MTAQPGAENDDDRTGDSEARAGRRPIHERSIELTDPRAMRAYAHPVRMALIGLLRTQGPLTATQAAEQLGESSGTCSFHLRQLAKYGFCEEAGGGRGREKPWRATAMFTTWNFTAGRQRAQRRRAPPRRVGPRALPHADRAVARDPRGRAARVAARDRLRRPQRPAHRRGARAAARRRAGAAAAVPGSGDRGDEAPEGARRVELIQFAFPAPGRDGFTADMPDPDKSSSM